MLADFKKYIAEHTLLEPGQKVLLGISGGVDSVVMAHLFKESGIKTEWAHCNFHLRGQESDGDEAFVRKLAADWDVPLHCIDFNTKLYAEKHGISIQMAARELRFNWFDDLMVQQHCNSVATAHHSGDSIETFFVNIIRGSGLKGLTGIAPKNGNIIHPLLFCNRESILEYAHKHNLSYREDSSNASTKYMRNSIRHELMPLLQKLNPSFDRRMLENMELLRQSWELQEQIGEQARKACLTSDEYFLEISVPQLLQFRPLQAVLHYLIGDYGFSGRDVAHITNALNAGSGKLFASSTHRLLIDRDRILIEPLLQEHPDNAVLLEEKTGEIKKPIHLKWEMMPGLPDGFSFPKDNQTLYLDAANLKWPLKLRQWQPGDSFVPFGMTGRKKISDFLIDEKINRFEKENVFVLLSGNEVCCIPGYRSSELFRIMKGSPTVFRVEFGR